ncbi:hypothetical protein NDU88_003318 [Pleurodeles waltl]|uniref:Uncharacterized protein n=1 Tax=Pleurodeles waltl TaxID=8319 RepID=A0AAV7W369_PLEWA|nr:hypothetical protein NDU88_003318 [Pleurodeles waltl]
MVQVTGKSTGRGEVSHGILIQGKGFNVPAASPVSQACADLQCPPAGAPEGDTISGPGPGVASIQSSACRQPGPSRPTHRVRPSKSRGSEGAPHYQHTLSRQLYLPFKSVEARWHNAHGLPSSSRAALPSGSPAAPVTTGPPGALSGDRS